MRFLPLAALLSLVSASLSGGAPLITQQPQDQAVGAGENAALTVTATGATAFQWYKGPSGDTSAPVPGATGPLCITLPLYAAGQFWVQASDASGATASRTVELGVNPSVPGRLMGMGINDYGQLGGMETEYRPTPQQIASGVTQMAGNGYHILFVKEDSSLWALGYNSYGQLGDGSSTRRNTRVQVPGGGPVIQVAAGGYHSLFLRSDGTVWSMGENSDGQLGIGSYSSKNTPQQVMTAAVQIAAGQTHSHFLKADGSLWATGQNSSGQQGSGNTTRTNIPTLVASGVAAVASRYNHTLIIKTDGSLWATGQNGSGQLGDGSYTQRNAPVPVASGVSFCSAGFFHSVFRKVDGTWWAMGDNDDGELGDGSSTRRITPVNVGSGIRQASAGYEASLWVKDDGLIRAMGTNDNGQAGNGTLNDLSSPQPALTSHRALRVASARYFSLFLDASPRFTTQPADVVVLPGQAAGLSVAAAEGADVTYQWYRGASGDSSQPVGTGLSYSVSAPVADATYWVRISNAYGSSDSRAARVIIAIAPSIQAQPAAANIAAGEGSALRVQASGGGLTYQWYRGPSGDISAPLTGATADLLVVPPLYATQSYWVRVGNLAGTLDSTAATITVAPVVGATLRGCGWNASNQILIGGGTNRTYPEVCSTGVIAFDAGSRASHFITTDHSLWELGNNTDTLNQHGTSVIAVSGGEAFALFIKEDFSAWGVRTNDYGQLGDGTTTTRKTPVQVATNVARVSAGQYFSFFVKTDGSLWATGKNDHAQFGIGTWENSLTPIYITSGVIDAAAGEYQGFFLKADGTLWGMGEAYTLGIGISTYEMKAVPVQIASGVSRISGTQGHVLFLKTDGSLWSTDPSFPSYQATQVATDVVKFAAGSSHTIFTKSDGSLWGVGYNGNGQLGNGTTSGTVSTPVAMSSEVLKVSAGSNHSLFTDLKPGFTKHPLTAFVPTGTSTALSVTGVGSGPLTYQWYRGERGDTSQPLAGEVSTTYTTPVLTSDARYWVRVTNPHGSWDSLTGVLTVVSVPQITTAPVAPAAIAAGGNAVMSVGITGLGLTIQWYRGQPGDTSSPVVGATGSFFVSPPLTGNSNFWVRISNAAGTVESAAVPVSVIPSYPSVLRSTGANTKGQLGNGSTSASITTSFTGIGMPAVAVAAGANHSLFLNDDGSLWAMGDNAVGQLGDNSTTLKSSPVRVADDVVQITAGMQHSMFIKKDGTLWGMGYNSDGRLGTYGGSFDVPRQITTGIAQVSAGDEHTLYLTTTGRMFSGGSNTYGQRGSTPPLGSTGVVKVAAGGKHSLYLKSDGTVWAMGLNTDGQLGDGSLTNRTTPVQVAADLAGGIRVVDIVAGGRHSLLLRSDGSVWTCGANNYGQAGLGSAIRSSTWTQITSIPAGTATAIAAGADHSFILRNNGALYASGRNQSGQLGDGSSVGRTVFAQVATGITRAAGGGSHSMVAAAPPVVLAQSLDTGAVAGLTPTLSITAGGMPNFSYKWYRGESGNTSQQIAGATAASYLTPSFTEDASYWVRITGPGGTADSQTMRVLAVTQPGITVQPQATAGLIGMPAELSVAVSGGVPSFQWYYGNPGDTSSPIPGGNSALLRTPRLTTSVNVWVRVTNAAGTVDSQAAFVSAAPGQLVTMGARSFGQLGDGGTFEYPTPQQVASGAAKIRVSDYASYVLKADGTLWGAGSVNWSEDVSSSKDAFIQLASDVADFQSGLNYHIFLKTDGTLWAYGSLRAHDEDPYYHWDAPFQVASGVTAIAGGSGHYLYLTADGTLRGAGDNFWGQLSADNDTWEYGTPVVVATGVVSASAGRDTTLFVKTDGSLWGQGWNNGALGNDDNSSPDGIPVQIATGVSRAFAGYHTLFIKTDGSLWATGSNDSGQLGDGTNARRTTPAQIATNVASATPGTSHSLFLKTDGSLWAMGSNLRGELGTGDYTASNLPVQVASGVTDLAAANDLSLFTDTQGRVWAMGSNSYGQFGIEVEFFRKEPEILTGPVTRVETSSCSFFIRGDGSLWGMGANEYGQLGDGSYRYRYTPVLVSSGVKDVSSSGAHTLFIKDDDSLWGMGSNVFNPLGDAPSSNPLPIRVAEQVQDIATGSDFSLFVKKDGTLWGMGRNWDYQLGMSAGYDWVEVPTLITSGVSRVASGGNHTLFLKVDGTLWAMGQNYYGQTGDPTPWYTSSPRQMASGVVDLAAGWNHSVWIDASGTLWGVGSSSYGEMGTLPDNAYQTTTPVVLAQQVARVWATFGSTLFLKKDGTLWGLGDNYTGILGDTGEVYEGVPQFIASGVATAAAGGDHILFVSIGPVITQQPETLTVDAGSGAEFTVAATGNGPLSYQWFRGVSGDTSQAVSGATTASFSAPPASTAVNYWVRVSNPFANTDSHTAVLALTGGGAPHYQSWAITKGLTDLSRSADPDHDGLSNYLEYFFNTDPLAPSAGSTPVGAKDGGYFTITFRRLRGSNAEYLPLWSPDLADWDEPENWSSWVSVGDVDGDGTTQLITISRPIAEGETRGFLRVEISEP